MSEPEPSVPHAHGPATRWFVAVSALLSIVIAAGSGYAFAQYWAAKKISTCDWAGCEPGKPKPSGGTGVAVGPCADDVCNYLLLGSDSRKGLTPSEIDQFGSDTTIGGENRADTIMLVHTDPNLQKAIIVSFPRDLWVNIPGHGYDKINAAFEGGIEGGGPLLVAKTIHALTGLKINHYLYVDLAGFQGVVKTLGGVDMCISGENVNTPGYVEGESGSVYYPEPGYIADPYTGLHIKPGCQTLPPDQALAYVRARHLKCDAAAPDFYRIGRQQQFMRALITKMLQPDELLQLPSRIRPILSNMKRDPDLNPADLFDLEGTVRPPALSLVERPAALVALEDPQDCLPETAVCQHALGCRQQLRSQAGAPSFGIYIDRIDLSLCRRARTDKCKTLRSSLLRVSDDENCTTILEGVEASGPPLISRLHGKSPKELRREEAVVRLLPGGHMDLGETPRVIRAS